MKPKAEAFLRSFSVYDMDTSTSGPFLVVTVGYYYDVSGILSELDEGYEFLSSHASFKYTRDGEEKLIQMIFRERNT